MSQVMAEDNKSVTKHHELEKCRISCFLEKLNIKRILEVTNYFAYMFMLLYNDTVESL